MTSENLDNYKFEISLSDYDKPEELLLFIQHDY